MYVLGTYLVITYFCTYLPTYRAYLFTVWVTKVKPGTNSVEVHLQLTTLVSTYAGKSRPW
jgi:hypothetical protein